MFPAPPTLSWAGFGIHFQMGNNFREEELLKLWAILLPAPTGTSQPRSWNFPEVGKLGLSWGEKPRWIVETGCLAWLSCGQVTWAPEPSRLLHSGAAPWCQAPLPSSFLTNIPDQASESFCHFAGNAKARVCCVTISPRAINRSDNPGFATGEL